MDPRSAEDVPFLRGASARGRANVMKGTRVETYAAGSTIFQEGDPPDFVYVIKRGAVEVVSRREDGSFEIQRTLGPGRLLGELGTLGGHARTATVRAVEDSELLAIERDAFLEAYETEPSIGVEIASAMAAYLLDAEVVAQDLLFLDLKGRVAKRLSAFLGAPGAGVHVVVGTDDMSVDEVTQRLQELARRAAQHEPYSELARLALLSGGSKVAVERILIEMQREGILIAAEGDLIITDRTKLEELARYR